DHPARGVVPVRCAEPDQRRHEIDAARIRYLARQALDALGGVATPKDVSEPGDRRSGGIDVPFEGVRCMVEAVARPLCEAVRLASEAIECHAATNSARSPRSPACTTSARRAPGGHPRADEPVAIHRVA